MTTELEDTFRGLTYSLRRAGMALLACVTLVTVPVVAQDRLQSMPGYDRFTEMAPQIGRSFVSGAIRPAWAEDGESFRYSLAGTAYRFDLTTGTSSIDAGTPANKGSSAPSSRRTI